MKRFILYLILCALCWPTTIFAEDTSSQRVAPINMPITPGGVALVMSGGAAKGITHIGVIQALEENDIPIDYVAGTSMGAIVASLYAIGFTVDEMKAILQSKEFDQWQTGNIAAEDRYFYRQGEQTPALVNFSARLGDLLHFDKKANNDVHLTNVDKLQERTVTPTILPTSVRNPRMARIGMIDLYGPANAVAGGNFNNLFVPFRAVASDVNNKREVVLRSGDLGDAVRASMSYPFIFSPVTINGTPLYDGGIFNNFPVDVAQKEFYPSYIIGSNVSKNPEKATDTDPFALLSNMIIRETDYSVPEEKGIQFNFSWDRINSWDFSQVEPLVKLGYDSTMAHIDEIKRAVKQRRTQEEVMERREAFKAQFEPFTFTHLEITGVSEEEEAYLHSFFHTEENEPISYQTFRQNYFQLLSDDAIAEVIPHVTYDNEKDEYTLHIKVRTSDQLRLSVGGNITTASPLQAYVGFQYQDFFRFPIKAWFDAQVGNTYNSTSIGARVDFTPRVYLKGVFVSQQFDYMSDARFYYFAQHTLHSRQRETYLKISAGMPITQKASVAVGIGTAYMHDYYSQTRSAALRDSIKDDSEYSFFNTFVRFEGNTLNHQMYPTSGQRWHVIGQIPLSWETSHSTSYPETEVHKAFKWWLETRGHWDGYFRLHKHFSLGAEAELVYSKHKNEDLASNLTANRLQMPHYAPTPHSKLVFNNAFSANQYLAVGIKPILLITNNWQVRLEAYGFAPMRRVKGEEAQEDYNFPTYETKWFNIAETGALLVEAATVYTFPRGAVSVFGNWYSYPRGNWNVGLNLGILLFKDKFLD